MNKKILVIDSGMFVDLARLLSQDNLVYYYSVWETSFPSVKDIYVGVGFDRLGNFVKVNSWTSCIDDVDFIIFTDVGLGELCDWLRNKGYICFGSGLGEELELKREIGKRFMEDSEISVSKRKICVSISDAIKYLKSLDEGKYVVKTDVLSEEFSTVYGDRDNCIEELEKLRDTLGYKSIPFFVENYIDGVEVASCGFINSFGFLDKFLLNFEHLYGGAGCWVDRSNKIVQEGLLKTEKNLVDRYDYRGVIDLNSIVSRNSERLFGVEWTCRFGAPMSRMMVRMMSEGWSEIFYMLASNGGFRSDFALTNGKRKWGIYVSCFYDENLDKGSNMEFVCLKDIDLYSDIALERVMLDEDGYIWALPGYPRLFQVCGFGETFKDAVEKVKRLLNLIRGKRIKFSYDLSFIEDIRNRILTLNLEDIKIYA